MKVTFPPEKSDCHPIFQLIQRLKSVEPVLHMAKSFTASPWLRRVLLCAMAMFIMLSPADSAAPETGWDVTKIEGRDYVSLDSIKRFYKFDKMARSGGSIIMSRGDEKVNLAKFIALNFRIGGNECLMNDVKFVFSHPIASQGDKVYVSRVDLAKLIDPVLRPNFIKNAGNFRTVILDPGHGGKDPGATNPFGTEAGYNLKVANMVKALLERSEFKYRVVMTRTTNEYLSLQQRVDAANAVKEDAIFISIHFNSGGRSARGVETFTLSPPGVSHYGREFKEADNQTRAGNEHDSANIALATAVHGWSMRELGKNTLDRGIKRARFSVLSGVRHPAILLEGGFMSHPYEARLIENQAYQQHLAKGIVLAIDKYRRSVGRPQMN